VPERTFHLICNDTVAACGKMITPGDGLTRVKEHVTCLPCKLTDLYLFMRPAETAGLSGTNREEPMPETPSHPAYLERFKHEWNMAKGPKHEHDCEDCAYLGTDVGPYVDTDLYWCGQGGRPTPIARHGAYGEYVSGRAFIDRVPLLALAYVRAVKAGLLYTDTLPGLED
jgi:hypothetical protein